MNIAMTTDALFDLTHTQGDTTVESTVGDRQLALTGHINRRALFCGESTAVDLKIHVAGCVITGQGSIL